MRKSGKMGKKNGDHPDEDIEAASPGEWAMICGENGSSSKAKTGSARLTQEAIGAIVLRWLTRIQGIRKRDDQAIEEVGQI